MGRTGLAKQSISTGDHKPIKGIPRRLLERMNTNVEKHVKDIMENIIIEPSNNS